MKSRPIYSFSQLMTFAQALCFYGYEDEFAIELMVLSPAFRN